MEENSTRSVQLRVTQSIALLRFLISVPIFPRFWGIAYDGGKFHPLGTASGNSKQSFDSNFEFCIRFSSFWGRGNEKRKMKNEKLRWHPAVASDISMVGNANPP